MQSLAYCDEVEPLSILLHTILFHNLDIMIFGSFLLCNIQHLIADVRPDALGEVGGQREQDVAGACRDVEVFVFVVEVFEAFLDEALGVFGSERFVVESLGFEAEWVFLHPGSDTIIELYITVTDLANPNRIILTPKL